MKVEDDRQRQGHGYIQRMTPADSDVDLMDETSRDGSPSTVGLMRQAAAEEMREAVIKGDADQVKALLRKKVNVNHRYQHGLTALHLAVVHDKQQVIPALIRAGADIYAKTSDEHKLTPVDFAVAQENQDMLELLADGTKYPLWRCFLGPVLVALFVVLVTLFGFLLLDDVRWDGWLEAETEAFGEVQEHRNLAVLLVCICLLSLLLVNRLDPGTVTHEQVEYANEKRQLPEEDIVIVDQYRFGVIHPGRPLEAFRWCRTCELWRPRNVSHCAECRRCFWRFDHHCFAVGNCVAAHNHKFFALMLICGASAWLIGAVSVLQNLHVHGAFASPGLWFPPRASQMPLYLSFVYILSGLFSLLLTLWGFVHTFALVFNYNTKMCLRPSPENQGRLFNNGEDLWLLFCVLPSLRPWQPATPLEAPQSNPSRSPSRVDTGMCGAGERDPLDA